MTSREIIFANLDHADPPRPGFTFSGGRRHDMAGGGLGPSATYTQKRWQDNTFEYYDDPWGNVWRRMKDGCKAGEVHIPALRDWADLDAMTRPDFDNPARFERAREIYAANPDKFRLFGMPGWVFATSRYLRKMEIYFMDLIEYREEIDRLHDIVTGLLERVIRLAAEAGADGIFYCEDLGVQDRVLIGPAMWRDVFGPHYERLVGTAHECGLRVLMHSCGYNWELLDDLAATGIDCFQFDQPYAYKDVPLADKLKEHRIALWSPVDIQQILPTGDRAVIEAEAERMVRTYNGFLIIKNYPDLPGIGVKEEWDAWAYNAILRAAGVDAEEAP